MQSVANAPLKRKKFSFRNQYSWPQDYNWQK